MRIVVPPHFGVSKREVAMAKYQPVGTELSAVVIGDLIAIKGDIATLVVNRRVARDLMEWLQMTLKDPPPPPPPPQEETPFKRF